MRRGLRIMNSFSKNNVIRTSFGTDGSGVSEGLHSCIQRFIVILMTYKGTDSIRPWFGTYFPGIPKMNVINMSALELFVKEQVNEAREQFYRLENEDTSKLTDDDRLKSVEVVDMYINAQYRVVVKLHFTSYTDVGFTTVLEEEVNNGA